MGVFSKPITFVGREFRNEVEAIAYLKVKGKITDKDLDDMGPRLHYLLEECQKKGYPDGGLYSIFSGDEDRGYYIGYDVYHSNPIKMQEKIAKASAEWKAMFKEEPKIVQAILYT